MKSSAKAASAQTFCQNIFWEDNFGHKLKKRTVETKKFIKNLINENVEAKKKMLKPEHIECIYNVAYKIVETYRNKKKTIICGNGGSALDALRRWSTDLKNCSI
ncbi:hypothetical protein AGMMS49573_06040 [Endomicrobiia bacterium]|nr:hypothetical protein AGMMS49573_06040 [Endomicrobiia bacterium]